MANLALRDDRHVGDITIAGGIEVVLDSLAHLEGQEEEEEGRGGEESAGDGRKNKQEDANANVQAAGFWALAALTRWVADGHHREAREVIQQSGE